jgi:hypothetical protein
MEDVVGIFYCHMAYFLPFDVFYGYLVYFSRFGMLYQEKSGNPASEFEKATEDCF